MENEMNTQLLDSLSIPTGDAGWPKEGDWLYCIREDEYDEPEWVRVREIENNPDYYINFTGEHFFDYITYYTLDELKQDFSKHVPVMKLLQELADKRDKEDK